MNPKKAKDFVPELAKELGMDQEMVADLIDFAFSTTKKKLSSLAYLQLGIPGLGIFRLSYKKVKDFSKKNKNKKITEKSFKSRKYKEDLAKKMVLINKAVTNWNNEYARMADHKVKKDEYKKNLRTKKANP